MLPRPTDTVLASVVISELPAMRRMPAPTPLPTVRVPQPGLMARLGDWLAPRLARRADGAAAQRAGADPARLTDTGTAATTAGSPAAR